MLTTGIKPGDHVGVTVVVLFAAIVSLLGVAVWLGLLIWAARGDGRVQREHDRDTQRDRQRLRYA